MRHSRCGAHERGVVGGAEAVALGTLVLLAGTILIINAWAVIDTRTALDAAAREYLRTYTEADDPLSAHADAAQTTTRVLRARGALAERVHVAAPDAALFGPCAPAAVTLSVVVPAVHMPFVGDFGDHTVTVRAVELIDAHRSITAGAAYDAEATACAH